MISNGQRGRLNDLSVLLESRHDCNSHAKVQKADQKSQGLSAMWHGMENI